MTPAALRAMRAAVGWSMRDLAEQADVALASVLRMEGGGRVGHRTELKVQAAFAAQGVKTWWKTGGWLISILDTVPPGPSSPADELRALPWVCVSPLVDGQHRVEFRVPAKHRPDRWPAAQALPLKRPRPCKLDDLSELKEIKRDALTLGARLAKMTEQEGSPTLLKRASRQRTQS